MMERVWLAHLGACASPLTSCSAWGKGFSEQPGLYPTLYAYLWGTQELGWRRHLILITLEGGWGFLKEASRTDKKHMPCHVTWASSHCTIIMCLPVSFGLHMKLRAIAQRRSQWSFSQSQKEKKRDSPSTADLWPCSISSNHHSQLGQHPFSHTEKGCWHSHLPCWAWCLPCWSLRLSVAVAWEVCRDVASAKPPALAFQCPTCCQFPRSQGFLNIGWSVLHDSVMHAVKVCTKWSALQVLFRNVL